MQPREIVRLGRAHLYHRLGLGADQRETKTLIFREHKIAYIPIPKAACSSIKYALLPLIGVDPDSVPLIHAFGGFDSARFDEIASEIDPDWFIFTVVRNPTDRVMSAWRDKLRSEEKITSLMKYHALRPGDSFDRFMRVISLWPSISLDEHVMPQSMLLHHARDFPVRVYRFEDLDDAWNEISAEITRRSGIAIGPLQKRNATEKRPPGIDNRTIRRLERLYREDFVQFGYDDRN